MRHLLAAALVVLAAACSRTPTSPVVGELPAVVVHRSTAAPPSAPASGPAATVPGTRRSQ
jgi:hypothetical protein